MKREHDLKRRLRSLSTLGDAVSAMKSLSAHHFREARGAVEPARLYREGVEQIASRVGARLAAGGSGVGLLVMGGELGLCGSFNSELAAVAAQRRAELASGPTLCVGRRVAALLSRRGVHLAQIYPAPTSVGGITEALLHVAEDLSALYIDRRLASFHVVSSRFAGVGAARPQITQLLPLAAKPAAPVAEPRYVPRAHLEAGVLREFLYITLYDLLLDSLASEHSARLLATQAAEEWLDDRRDRLRRHLAALRRESSTQEMLEISAGRHAPP